jgi:ferritin
MPRINIKPATLAELQRQFNHELSAAHSYVALAIWCEAQNLKGFARYFSTQAHEERVHAQKFISHLLDRCAPAPVREMPAPQTSFLTVLEAAKHAQALEQENTEGINRCYETAMRENDYPAQVLLHWFIQEQVEEENWADEMVDRIEAANCAGGMSDLDRHIERYLTEDAADAAKSG